MSATDTELRVARELVAHLFEIPSTEVVAEKTHPPRPDAVVRVGDKVLGVEVGAVFDEALVEVDRHQEAFLRDVNEMARRLGLRGDVKVRLVMQDDKDIIIHKPSAQMSGYTVMPAWLDGVFVDKVHAVGLGCPSVVLNQHSSSRPARGLFPRGKDLEGLARELVRYANALDDGDFFSPWHGRSGPTMHHVVTADQAGRKVPIRFRNKWSASIDAKLAGKQYSATGLNGVYLALHNLVPTHQGQAPWSDGVWHDYWHNLNGYVATLRSAVSEQARNLYAGIYFLDYSSRLAFEPTVYDLIASNSTEDQNR